MVQNICFFTTLLYNTSPNRKTCFKVLNNANKLSAYSGLDRSGQKAKNKSIKKFKVRNFRYMNEINRFKSSGIYRKQMYKKQACSFSCAFVYRSISDYPAFSKDMDLVLLLPQMVHQSLPSLQAIFISFKPVYQVDICRHRATPLSSMDRRQQGSLFIVLNFR